MGGILDAAQFILKCILVLWTSPNTLIGGIFGVLALATGGRVQYRRGCIEFSGGFVKWLLKRLPNGPIGAMTLGHVIIGLNRQCLSRARDHEHVHVKQYERWGPLFLPAYFGCSLYMRLLGKNPYLDNPFEVEAYSQFP
ncbi:MAG: hypothetical protein R3C03_02355 [Pirellulaceae bacterium]